MKPTAEESADLKMALKHDAETSVLAREAERFPMEADEAYAEAEAGDYAAESWAANRLASSEEHS